MKYGPAYDKLATLSVSPTYASLKLYDGSQSVDLWINPQVWEEDHSGEYSRLAVLYTGQPLVKFKNSQSSYSLPDVRLWSEGNNKDLTPVIDRLRSWVAPGSTTLVPPLLKFIWGDSKIPRCYLGRLKVTVTQTRQGRPTEAKLALDLILAPEPAAAIAATSTTTLNLTDRERTEQAKAVTAALAADKTLAKKYAWDAKQVITVAADGTISATAPKGKPRKLDSLQGLLGDNLSPGLKAG